MVSQLLSAPSRGKIWVWSSWGIMAQTWPSSDPESIHVFGPDSAQIWPRSTPKPACTQDDWLKSAGLVEGPWWLGGSVIQGSMHGQLGAQVSMRVQVEGLSGVKGHRKKTGLVTNRIHTLFVDERQKIPDADGLILV